MKKMKNKFDANKIMNRLSLRFFNSDIQQLYNKNQLRQLSMNRKLIKGGLLVIGIGFFLDNLLVDKSVLKDIYVTVILISTSLCLIIFEKFILKYFSLLITVLSITIIMIDFSQKEDLDGCIIVQEQLWVIYNKGVLLMVHVMVAFTCIPEWYLKSLILASSTQFIVVKQFIVKYYDNYIQLEIIFLLAIASFYFQEKREKKLFYMKCIKKKELESWKHMLDTLVPVSVFVVNKEQESTTNSNISTTIQPISQANIIFNQSMILSSAVLQNKINIEFINKTCLKTFDISSKEEFEQKLRQILVKRKYVVGLEQNKGNSPYKKPESITTNNIQLNQLGNTQLKINSQQQYSPHKQEIVQHRNNKNNDLEQYSKNLFKVINQLRNQKNIFQCHQYQQQQKDQNHSQTISNKSNNNIIQTNNLQQKQENNQKINNNKNNNVQQSVNNIKQLQILNCRYSQLPNSSMKTQNEIEKKIQYYDVRLIESVWNGKEAIIGVITDVSEQVLAERKQEMMSYKNSVMNTITHDLKTPLNGIQLILSSALEGERCNKKDTYECINSALSQGQLLESRINDLLDYSKLINSQDNINSVRLNVDSFDLNQSILHCLSIYKQSAQNKQITLLFNKINIQKPPADNKYPVLMCSNDKQRFQQILVNLIGNALKFTFQGSVSVQTEHLCNDELQISVEDTGIGMSQEIMTTLQDKSHNFQFEKSEKKNMRHGNNINQIIYFISENIWLYSNILIQRFNYSNFQYYLGVSKSSQQSKIFHQRMFIHSKQQKFNTMNFWIPLVFYTKKNNIYQFNNYKMFLKGFGLGLEISKRLIRLISKEDSLSVNSEQNHGTKITFKMLLNYETPSPFILNSDNQLATQNLIQSSSAIVSQDILENKHAYQNPIPIFNSKFIDKTKKLESLKIMIVDDTSFNIIALTKFIQKILGKICFIDVAYNGLQAVNIYKKRLLEQKKKQQFAQIVFSQQELHNQCGISQLEHSSDNVQNGDQDSVEVNHEPEHWYNKRSTLYKIENQNLKSPYDIIFMDINMPVMDGYQAISSIRSLERNCYMEYQSLIAVVTAFGEECDRQESFNIGANYHITKPLQQDLLKSIIDSCRSSQFQQQQQ